jgi:hypothetical protein
VGCGESEGAGRLLVAGGATGANAGQVCLRSCGALQHGGWWPRDRQGEGGRGGGAAPSVGIPATAWGTSKRLHFVVCDI